MQKYFRGASEKKKKSSQCMLFDDARMFIFSAVAP